MLIPSILKWAFNMNDPVVQVHRWMEGFIFLGYQEQPVLDMVI